MQLIGPFTLNYYNGALICGMYLFLFLLWRDKRREVLVSTDQLFFMITTGTFISIIMARIIHIMSNWNEYDSLWKMISIWNGGLSILGVPIGLAIYALILKARGVNFFAIADIAALYGPLFHAVGRLGCLGVGCCHGAPTDLPWAITYDSGTFAPAHCSIHPTQLYSSALFLILFFALFHVAKTKRIPGEISLLYLIGMGTERFLVDFFRGDRMMHGIFSFAQWWSLLILSAGILGIIYLRWSAATRHEPL